MRVDLRPLRAERGGTLVIDCHETVESRVEGIPFVEPVTGRLTLHNLGAALRIEGSVRTAARLVCDRCASPYRYRLHAAVDEELNWADVASPDAGDVTYLVGAGDAVGLDVGVLAREVLVLALPMVARCGPDCRGLCDGCGADLRIEPCRCPPEARRAREVDPRLRALAAWREAEPSGPA
ncbi:MAG: DUF177 domain-containing protein [Armatimonadota bacterium]|nr:DUF177 domain-containing protein [Armatimonadota bacterium]MDR7453599.1 DUF177 domain-containing protein [Armatimonadota bacterium]MDR7456921.1 DUF177 domain-containing protein [Armatimonadota bacterium]MDR7496773.1 DUF177 domain-containing protein [Armatimonadota bacterium]MDR7511221.1 DUF177 domain-containing protein [Armatimonadota bacterium]